MSAAENRPEEERDPIAEEEAEAAASEAAHIGGDIPPDTDDPAQQPLIEGGQGVAEGFELAEEDLEDIASHGDQHRFPGRLAGRPEEPTDAAYGEADEEISQDADQAIRKNE
jgi:hypothetical protein